MDEFVGGVAAMEVSSEQAWTTFLQTLVVSVQRLSGRKLPIGNTKLLEAEAQELRDQLKELTREVWLIYSFYAYTPSHCVHRMRRQRPAVAIVIDRKALPYTSEMDLHLCLHPHEHRRRNRKPTRVPNPGMRHVDSQRALL